MPPEFRELCASRYAGLLLGLYRTSAARVLGQPDAEMSYGEHTVQLWRVSRVLAHRQGFQLPTTAEPLRFYGVAQAVARVEELTGINTTRGRIEAFLGEPDAVLISTDREDGIYSADSVNAAVLLIGEAPKEFHRVRPYRRRISAQQRSRIERRRTRTMSAWKRPPWICKRCGSGTKAHSCRAKHRWSANG